MRNKFAADMANNISKPIRPDIHVKHLPADDLHVGLDVRKPVFGDLRTTKA